MTTADLLKEEPKQEHAPLFGEAETSEFRMRWHDIQGTFVDDPQTAVQEADELVASLIKRLTESFADERSRLESAWEKGRDTSTEDLRQTLRRYRSFFDRLLSV